MHTCNTWSSAKRSIGCRIWKLHLRINYMRESTSEIMLVMMITNQLVRECLCCTVAVTSKELQIEMKSHYFESQFPLPVIIIMHHNCQETKKLSMKFLPELRSNVQYMLNIAHWHAMNALIFQDFKYKWIMCSLCISPKYL